MTSCHRLKTTPWVTSREAPVPPPTATPLRAHRLCPTWASWTSRTMSTLPACCCPSSRRWRLIGTPSSPPNDSRHSNRYLTVSATEFFVGLQLTIVGTLVTGGVFSWSSGIRWHSCCWWCLLIDICMDVSGMPRGATSVLGSAVVLIWRNRCSYNYVRMFN